MSDGIEVEQIVKRKPRRMALATSLDKDVIREAYEDVRSDFTDTEWAVFKFDGPQIIVHGRGQCFEEFRQQFGDSECAFGYIRIQVGDEMSKRKKFIFLTWIGREVGVIQRAKMSTGKAIIKDVLHNFAVEQQADEEPELDIGLFREALIRAGGANYGTGIRDN
ncbi:coactosin-like protein [Drosophila miranda]|uniref:coactosin-like protein n=1 Tax=Drosophila miranda TaxID=7229 RepID=UPI0007E774AB|nr:coactosin-like protein [Drosophila miranda]